MAIMIRVAELMAKYFLILWEFIEFSIFLAWPPRIPGGITWRLQNEPPISNSKIVWNAFVYCTLSPIFCINILNRQ